MPDFVQRIDIHVMRFVQAAYDYLWSRHGMTLGGIISGLAFLAGSTAFLTAQRWWDYLPVVACIIVFAFGFLVAMEQREGQCKGSHSSLNEATTGMRGDTATARTVMLLGVPVVCAYMLYDTAELPYAALFLLVAVSLVLAAVEVKDIASLRGVSPT